MVKTFTAKSYSRFDLTRAGVLLGCVSVDGNRITTLQIDGDQLHRASHNTKAGFVVGKATEVTVEARQIDADNSEVTISASRVSIVPPAL